MCDESLQTAANVVPEDTLNIYVYASAAVKRTDCGTEDENKYVHI